MVVCSILDYFNVILCYYFVNDILNLNLLCYWGFFL